MVGEDHVAAGEADVLDGPQSGPPRVDRHTGKAQGVLAAQVTSSDRLVRQLVDGRRDGGEPHGLPVRRIGVAGRAGARAAAPPRGPAGLRASGRAARRGTSRRRTTRRAGSRRSRPGAGSTPRRPRSRSGSRCVPAAAPGRGRPAVRTPRAGPRSSSAASSSSSTTVPRPGRSPRVESCGRRRPRTGRCRRAVDPAFRLQRHERAGVAAVVHRVVDQPHMAAHGHPAARGVEVRLGGHRVLLVADLVGGVGEQFDERDAEVGGRCRSTQSGVVSASRSRISLAQGVVVAGGVVDDGRRRCVRGRAVLRCDSSRAVERGRAVGPEDEVGAVVALVEAAGRARCRAGRTGRSPDERKPVAGGVARPGRATT